MDLLIDPEFSEKIPPLTTEEFEQLEANILADGAVLSPLVVWNGIIVDGHNRYRIVQKHPEIPFQIHEKEFSDRYEVIAWICKNQLGRRNLTPEQRKFLIGKQYEAEKARHGKEAGTHQSRGEDGRFTVSPQNGDSRSAGRTSQRIAEETKTSKNYVQRAEKYAQGVEAADEVLPGIKDEILSGSISPTEKAVIAVARASPEERKELAEQLRLPRGHGARDAPKKESGTGGVFKSGLTFEDEDSEPSVPKPSLAYAQAITDGMASSPERENKDVSVDIIISELADAIDSMIFRWDFCLSANQANASLERCQKQVRELADKGIEYLKSYQGGLMKWKK